MRQYCCIIGVWCVRSAAFMRDRKRTNLFRVLAMHVANHFQQLREDLRRCTYDAAILHKTGFALEIRDKPARFEDQQAARRHVPWRQADLPEAVETSSRDVGQI